MRSEIIAKLSEILRERVVVSEEEIERLIYRVCLSLLKDKATGFADDKLFEDVKNSFLREPITINSLHYSERLEIADAVFYHIHTCRPTREQLEHAYEEMLKSRRYFDQIDIMKRILDDFFSGYSVRDGIVREYTKGKYKYGVLFSLIEDVDEDLQHHVEFAKRYPGEYVVIVPTENTPHPFIKFFKRHSEDVKKAGFKIWVVDTQRESVDPFIGYPKDFTLLRKFKNPKLATNIASLWRVNVEKID